MSSKSSYFWGTVTIVIIGSVIVYAIKKAKDAEETEEQAISLEEAQNIVNKGKEPVTMVNDQHNIHFTVGPIHVDGVPTSFELSNTDEILEEYLKNDVEVTYKMYKTLAEHEDEGMPEDEDEDESVDDGFDFNDDIQLNNNPKEDEELRYDPNSIDAKNQFIKMELAEWRPLEDVYQTMCKLFEFPFNPQNDGDEMLRTQIIDYRVRFFGFESKWVQQVTIADVILHYARLAEFNVGESIRYWVEYFVDLNELDFTRSNYQIDEVLQRLNSHTYFNEERQTFGLFGLTRECMDQAIRIANMNVDRSVTYQIEFNEFLKSCI